MLRSAWLLLPAFLFAPIALSADIRISDPWIKEAPPGVRVMAGYLVLENHDNDPIVLTRVSSPTFNRIELHRSVIENDVVRMEAQSQITVDPGDAVSFEPGGYHLMLYDPDNRLTSGELIELHFNFADDREHSVKAEVRRDTGNQDAHHNHGHHHHHHHH